MAIAVQGEADVVSSLEELAETINRESSEIENVFDRIASLTADAIERSIRIGDFVLEARSRVEGIWTTWVDENLTISVEMARRYARIATHKDLIRERCASVNEALRLIRGEPAYSNKRPEVISPTLAIEMRTDGFSAIEISEIVGCSRAAVYNALNPAYLERKRAADARRAAEKRALRRQSQDRAAKTAGVSEQWAALHRLGEQMDAVSRDGVSPEIREAFTSALKDIYRARDKISAVLGQI